MPSVILVNQKGEPIGTTDRAAAHRSEGKLHQAFSIFIFKSFETPHPLHTRSSGSKTAALRLSNRSYGGKGAPQDDTMVLLQKRAPHKLFGNLWTNTCCSHPLPNEVTIDAAYRRLREEFGITCDLKECGSFIYKAHDEKGTEYEYDTVFVGEVSDSTSLTPDLSEIAEWKWMNLKELQKDLQTHPQHYTPWLIQALKHASRYHP